MARRLFAAAFLAVVVAAPVRAAEVDALLPAETESVLFVNVRQILDSDLVKKYALGQIKQALQGNENQKMLKDLGLDPLKDVDRVTVGSWGKGPEDMEAVAIVRGRFDPEKLFAAAKDQASKNADKMAIVEEKVGDKTYKLVKITQDNQPKPFYVAVADEKTIVGANDKKLTTAILAAAEKGNAKPSLKKDLAALILKQDEKASVFACGLMEGKADNVPGLNNIPGVNPEKFQKGLEKLKTFAMTMRLTDEVGLEVVMGMKDADAADDFGAEISNLIGTAKGFLPLLTQNQPNLKPLVDEVSKTLKSKVKDKDVSINLKVTAESIGKATGAGD